MFPIMTFDEGILSPSMGYAFDRRLLNPYESLISLLWKFSWVNRLPAPLVVRHVAKGTIDPYEGIAATLDEINVRRVAQSLGVSLKTLRSTMPARSGRRGFCSDIRYCAKCMAVGYHSVVHQFGSYTRCPVHGCWLESACHYCGATNAYRIDANVLDARFRCAQCRSPYSRATTTLATRLPMPLPARVAITRAFIG